MLAGSDPRDAVTADLDRLAERAVREVVAAWGLRRVLSAPSPRSPLARMIRGESRFVSPSSVGTPGALRSWLLSVELAGKTTTRELGFDGLLLVADLVVRGKRYVTIAGERGWKRSEVAENYRRACWSLALEFVERGITRELEPEEGAA